MLINVVKTLSILLLLNSILAGSIIFKHNESNMSLCQANYVENAENYEKNYLKTDGISALKPEISHNQWLNMNDDHIYDYYSTDDEYNDDDADHFDGNQEDDDSIFSNW